MGIELSRKRSRGDIDLFFLRGGGRFLGEGCVLLYIAGDTLHANCQAGL